MSRSISSRDAVLGPVLALVVGAAIVVPVLAPTSEAFGRDTAVTAVAQLGAPATASDALPKTFPVELHGDGGIVQSSARFLGTYDGDNYWVARDARGDVCILAQSLAIPEQTVGSCATPAQLETDGVPVEVSGRWQLAAYLVPDSVDTSRPGPGFVTVAPNLVVVDPKAPAGVSLSLPRDPGASGDPVVLVETLNQQKG